VQAGGESGCVIRNAGYVYQEHGIDRSKSLSEVVKMRRNEIRIKEERVAVCPTPSIKQIPSSSPCTETVRYVYGPSGTVELEGDYLGPAAASASAVRLPCFDPACSTM
jgi:hypothetical protein